MYLLDTNIWLERLLGQSKSDEVGRFLNRVPSDELFLTDFAFHSICVILIRLKKLSALRNFVQDLLIDGSVSLVEIPPERTNELLKAMKQFKLDFDDAYQYMAARDNNLVLVSFDNGFTRTPLGKKTPAELLRRLK